MATITFPPSLRTSGPNGEGLPTIRFSASKKGASVGEFENVQLYIVIKLFSFKHYFFDGVVYIR